MKKSYCKVRTESWELRTVGYQDDNQTMVKMINSRWCLEDNRELSAESWDIRYKV